MDPRRIGSEIEKWEAVYAKPPASQDAMMLCFADEMASAVGELMPSGARILEAGCGVGHQSMALARSGRYDATLLDFSAAALRQARRLFERERLQAQFVEGDAFAQGAPECDLVFNVGVIEHYWPLEQIELLRGMASRSRGYVLAVLPNRFCCWYWLGRLQVARTGGRDFGSEIPVADIQRAMADAHLTPIGRRFMGAELAEVLIAGIEGLSAEARTDNILAAQHAAMLPAAQHCYLMAGLGPVRADLPASPSWSNEVVPERDRPAAHSLRLAAQADLDLRDRELQSSCRPVEAIRQQLEIVGSARGRRISLRVGNASDSRSTKAVGGSGGCASVAGRHRPSGDLGPQAAETRPARILELASLRNQLDGRARELAIAAVEREALRRELEITRKQVAADLAAHNRVNDEERRQFRESEASRIRVEERLRALESTISPPIGPNACLLWQAA
jgi:SAM-dependent methyltransferase